ncbi:fibronectin type III-like domain-contianing protein [Streptomyces sp. NBC_00316]|uniref:fibronectin type III-like domain-contianing protein n=1 Tax=Streptomyces sp. NBC_00316 TaxID=2975710 RepID=UPI002E2E7E95|nr:fibronectin type III-like domain-contianing protein [Streptomyces sp. NBC_00316]
MWSNYPFGYGQPFASFDIKAQRVQADARTVKVTAKVTNTSRTYGGEEVVQVYVSAPQTGLDKAYQQLTGYVKTDALAPGQSQTVTINFDTASLASYDESRTVYVLDAGELGGLTLSVTGGTTVTTTVDQNTDLSQVPQSGETVTDAMNNQVFTPNATFTSVDSAYRAYPVQGYNLRLGDLQRSAIRVLTTAAQSSSFEELAGPQGVHGITVKPYTAQFKDLEPAVTTDKSTVAKPSDDKHSGNQHGRHSAH